MSSDVSKAPTIKAVQANMDKLKNDVVAIQGYVAK
jgi:hypothetical protein